MKDLHITPQQQRLDPQKAQSYNNALGYYLYTQKLLALTRKLHEGVQQLHNETENLKEKLRHGSS